MRLNAGCHRPYNKTRRGRDLFMWNVIKPKHDRSCATESTIRPEGHCLAVLWFKNYEDRKELDQRKVICKMCKLEVKHCGNTTNLRNHLNKYHPETLLVKSSEPKQTALGKAFAVKLPANSLRGQKITKTVATIICKDIRPYRIVENDGLRRLVNIPDHATSYLVANDKMLYKYYVCL